MVSTIMDNTLKVTQDIFDLLPHQTLLKVAQCSRLLGHVVDQYSRATWGTTKLFYHFNIERISFLTALAESGAIVSGLQVLQFLLRDSPRSGELDIFVQPGGYRTIATALHRSGYRFNPEWESKLTHPYTIFSIYSSHNVQLGNGSAFFFEPLHWAIRVVKRNTNTGRRPIIGEALFTRECEIQRDKQLGVRVTILDIPPLEYLLFFSSTSESSSIITVSAAQQSPLLTMAAAAEMNFVSGHSLCSVFPRATFIENRAYVNTGAPTPPIRLPIHDYILKYLASSTHDAEEAYAQRNTERTAIPREIGDEDCWMQDVWYEGE